MAEANGSSKHVRPLIQDCWKAMRKGCEMTKIWVNSQSKLPVDLKKNAKNSKVLNSETNPGKFKGVDKRHLERCFGVAINALNADKSEEVFFIAPNSDEAILWLTGIKALIHNRATRILEKERREKWMTNEFEKLSKNGVHTIKYVNVLNFLTSQGFHAEPRLVKSFLKNTLGKEDDITCDEFITFLGEYLKRGELANLFTQCSSNGAFLSIDDLQYFLINRQCQENVTHEECRRFINAYELTPEGRKHNELGFDGFIKFMSSVEGELFNPEHDKVYQNMDQPFAHYYIASSHNTYLVSDQCLGDSSVDAYVKVLKEGCRCVELDCWDGDDGEPVIYHGHTLTSKILFKDVIKKIKKHAFEVSPYPVILNIENHCSVQYQQKMASYLVGILGEYLQKEPVDEMLPGTPDRFKYRIFVRGKKLKPQQEYSSAEFSMADDESTSSCDDSDDDNDSSQDQTVKEKKKKHKTPRPIAKEFSSLINYFVNVHFNSFEYSQDHGKFYQSSSFSEKKLEKLATQSTDDFIKYNTKQLSRVYPGGFRWDSSNYAPEDAWNVGCQIVALNLQTREMPVQLHHGKFRQNGKAGYILKPRFLRDPNADFNPNDVQNQDMARILKLTVISGHRLSIPEGEKTAKGKIDCDPYVRIEIVGVPDDKFFFKTKTIRNNNYNPKWSEGFTRKILVPQLALIRFSVYDEDNFSDDFIGQASMPVTSIRQGYRHVIMLNKKGESHTSGCLFVHVIIQNDDTKMAHVSEMNLKASPDKTEKSKSSFSCFS
ncbi:1-phosphatidylinositol 4,5-bisphosphate phosphodiesterase delta-4 [Exaiptasia diaphana]|nr:1-phosphatidylinositol 4,5-bisphosphate phosphodiesterase delta-4 [Exaiptasia diaphana]KXJ11285.1 1-phosphatidylinositol 4,5-bisphosphate phosphodiesterase delta-4 [Exaiptasia diaphana]